MREQTTKIVTGGKRVNRSQVIIYKYYHISVPEHCFCFSNSADPDDMPHSVVIHLGLRCL